MARRSLCSETNPGWLPTRGPTGWRDAADPDHQFKIPQTRKLPGLISRDHEILLAKSGGIALPAKKETAELFIYDSDLDKDIQWVIAQKRYNISSRKNMFAVKSWKALSKNVLQYKKIGHLVLSFHSYGGGLIIGGNVRDLDEKSVKKLFTNPSNVTTTQVDKISFDGCNVANKPRRLANFAKWFGAKSVSGYTWFIVVQKYSIEIPKGNDASSIRKDLAHYRKYVISTLPDATALSNRCRTQTIKVPFILSYGSEDGRTVQFPLRPRDQRTIKALDEAAKRNIAAAGVNQLQKEYDDAVIQAFEQVTITFKK